MQRRHNSKTPEQHKAVADALRAGATIKDALLAGGYSEGVAKKGLAAINGNLREALGQDAKALIAKGKKIDPKDLKHLLVGSLVKNVEEGKDNAHNSLKMLGSLKEVAAFEKDSNLGVVVIESPRAVPTIEAVPVVHELPENV